MAFFCPALHRQYAIGRAGKDLPTTSCAASGTWPPTPTLAALLQGTGVRVTWSAGDDNSGVDASTCLLEVGEDEGAWQTFSTECAGDETYDGEPGHVYTFRLTAADNVSNADSLEAEAIVPYAKHYYANGQRVAMRQGDVVYYLHSDHLGSTSVLSEGDGEPMPGSRVAYLPYGGLRLGDASTLPTDYGFTGQRACPVADRPTNRRVEWLPCSEECGILHLYRSLQVPSGI